MENAPFILLFWCFFIAIFILMLAFLIAGIVLRQKETTPNTSKLAFWGTLCVILSVICAIPVLSVAGYILYIYIG